MVHRQLELKETYSGKLAEGHLILFPSAGLQLCTLTFVWDHNDLFPVNEAMFLHSTCAVHYKGQQTGWPPL